MPLSGVEHFAVYIQLIYIATELFRNLKRCSQNLRISTGIIQQYTDSVVMYAYWPSTWCVRRCRVRVANSSTAQEIPARPTFVDCCERKQTRSQTRNSAVCHGSSLASDTTTLFTVHCNTSHGTKHLANPSIYCSMLATNRAVFSICTTTLIIAREPYGEARKRGSQLAAT